MDLAVSAIGALFIVLLVAASWVIAVLVKVAWQARRNRRRQGR